VRRTVPPSAEIQASIDKLLARGMVDDPQKMLSELARLGARLIIQRAVEEEFDSWLGRARYERRPEVSGKRNGFRPRHLQTAEGELRIEIPQAREAVMPFVSKLFFEVALQAAVENGPAQGAGDRRVRARPDARHSSRCARRPGSGRPRVRRSPGSALSFTSGLRRSVAARSTTSTWSVLFLDAIYPPVRPSGPKEGVICAWGITETGARALVCVRLGMRETKEDWLELGRDSPAAACPHHAWSSPTARPGCPQRSRRSGRGPIASTAPFRLRNLQAKLPKSEHDWIRSTTGARSPTRPRSRTASSASGS